MKELEQLRELNVKNPYLILNVSYDATKEEILIAYQKLMSIYQKKDNNKEDNYYLFQIFEGCLNVLLNSTTRKILNKQLGISEEEDKNLDTSNKNINVDSMLKNIESEPKRKEIRTTILLPEIIEELGLNKKSYFSFTDLSLIIQKYITRSIKTYSTDIKECSSIANKNLFLLDRKGNLKYVILKSPLFFSDYIEEYFSKEKLHTFGIYQPNTDDYNEELYIFNCCLVNANKILPKDMAKLKYVRLSDIIKSLELGNECLLKLKEYGYLTKPKYAKNKKRN